MRTVNQFSVCCDSCDSKDALVGREFHACHDPWTRFRFAMVIMQNAILVPAESGTL